MDKTNTPSEGGTSDLAEWIAELDQDGDHILREDKAKLLVTLLKRLARSATAPISGIKIAASLRRQRDELADTLRWLDSIGGLGVQVHERIRESLKGIPTYEQQLRNIAEGIGMKYEELIHALDRWSEVIPATTHQSKGLER